MLLQSAHTISGPAALLDFVDVVRMAACQKLEPKVQSALGQFFTPVNVAKLIASTFRATGSSIRLLDPGAGVGSLTAAFVAEICTRGIPPKELLVVAYEIDPSLVAHLRVVLRECGYVCEAAGVKFRAEVRQADFIASATSPGGLFDDEARRFDCVIMNPPYRKIPSGSTTRASLEAVGIEATNLYSAFMTLATRGLCEGGELAAITPRSFCNGPYFKPFRRAFLQAMSLERIHIFESRESAFNDDEVLQENVIIRAVRTRERPKHVVITATTGPDDDGATVREVPYDHVVRPSDPDRFIHVITDHLGDEVVRRMASFTFSLDDLGITVSTGRVVDFRAKAQLRPLPGPGTVPLIYPVHFQASFIEWPNRSTRKPNAIVADDNIREQLVPQGFYVLIKRFSAKEERRRIVAAVYDPNRVPCEHVAFENHLNYYHADGAGLPELLAKGVAVFLNSTLVDEYFRLFSGHTQVNAADLRTLPYPSADQLEWLGRQAVAEFPEQDRIDQLIETELLQMGDIPDPVKAKNRIGEALEVLKALCLPREQQNERSALTLLALLDLKPQTPWAKSKATMRGITAMMAFFATHYGRTYAPNTRETVRRFTIHQFLQAGLVVINPDKPTRPTNSPRCVYRIAPEALRALKSFGTRQWDKELGAYVAQQATLQQKYARERTMRRLPVVLPDGHKLTLSPGGQNILVKAILEEFCERFAPGAQVIYVGDTDQKFVLFDESRLAGLGVTVEQHGKMPDVIVYDATRHWLILIEAVTSHGPVSPKRRHELAELFKDAQPGLVYVTAFLNRRTMVQYLADISWETEVWIAESPSHMIHFNGERFLGPHES